MTDSKHIAVDAMGGEFGPEVTVPASLKALARHSNLRLHLLGDTSAIEPLLARSPPDASCLARLSVVHTDMVVSDEDKPSSILREKSNSSMYHAVALVKDATVQACVSAGNTGALLLAGRHLLKTVAGIERPAMLASIPGASRNSYLLDVGANVDCKAEQLFQFAVMGSVLAESLNGLDRARVALLNIGVEEHKGDERVQQAAQLLEACEHIHYVGFVEGSALYEGYADVVVCDGFVGNVTIKTSAGVVRVINKALDEIAMAESPLAKSLRSRIDPDQYNGASLLGLQGSIIKSHGNASEAGFGYAIERAIREAENNIPGLIAAKVARFAKAG